MTTPIVSTANQFEITGFSASHIIFDESNYATVWAKCKIDHQLQDVHLVFDFENLNDLLRFSGDNGEKILLRMIDEMMNAKQPPYILDTKSIFGKEAVFTCCKLSISKLESQDAALRGENIACYLVNNIMPISIVQQAKNLIHHVKDFDNTVMINNQIMNVCVSQLQEMYKYYLGLIELDINDDSARERAQLSNPQLYQMAMQAYKIN
jgi:hypothetical protein